MRSRVINLSLSLKVGRGGGRGRGLRNRQRNLSLAQLLVRDWRGRGFVAVSNVQSELSEDIKGLKCCPEVSLRAW